MIQSATTTPAKPTTSTSRNRRIRRFASTPAPSSVRSSGMGRPTPPPTRMRKRPRSRAGIRTPLIAARRRPGRGFCAGADLARGGAAFDRTAEAEYERGGGPADQPWRKPPRAVAAWDVRKPIIAAINGAAVGVGATLPMQWDIRIAAESARIGFVFVRRGVVPEALSTWTLPRLVGMARAAELLLTGRILAAREALEWGLVSRVVPDAELLATARALASEIARDTAPVSVAITKCMLWHMQAELDLVRADDLDARALCWTGTHPDAREAARAVLDTRAPRWPMR